MSRHQNRQQLELLIGRHGYHQACWGWGGRMGPQTACCDCGVPLGALHYPDGARCSWCGFWRHMATCPEAAQLARSLVA